VKVLAHKNEKLSWEDMAREMAASLEDWTEWDATTVDGLGSIPWETGEIRTIAEKKHRYHSGRRSAKKS